MAKDESTPAAPSTVTVPESKGTGRNGKFLIFTSIGVFFILFTINIVVHLFAPDSAKDPTRLSEDPTILGVIIFILSFLLLLAFLVTMVCIPLGLILWVRGK